jgi:hypothetical protein
MFLFRVDFSEVQEIFPSQKEPRRRIINVSYIAWFSSHLYIHLGKLSRRYLNPNLLIS